MSTIRNPVGPQPPSVYWRRRLLLLLVIVAVIVVVILIVVRPGSGTPGATPSPSHTTSQKPSSFASTGASGNASACDPSVVTLQPVTDAASYATGAQPQLSMTITNSGASACSFDVGTDAQVYVITSGADQIWSSKDCQTAPAANVQVLQPGKAVSTTPFAWDRTRSSKTTCTTNRPAVTAGGASYHLSVQLGAAKSAGTRQFLLQ
ncbi:hypothetical protein ACFPJ4_11805 [Lysinimonas soli]|uniref:DUF4232 domain-containing protein n=1 Tax=Lysinimonas soli TaxID=1074233 RepID=A0ABW0NQV8_9MICO